MYSSNLFSRISFKRVKGEINTVSLVIFLAVFLTACGNAALPETNSSPTNSPEPPTLTLTQTFTPAPSETPTLTPTLTPTSSPTATETPTITPSPTATATPTETLTPTITFTPMPIYNAPGTYSIGKCVTLKAPVIFCVLSVNVQMDRSMVFNVSWEALIDVTKGSDSKNPNMFIRDNLDYRYYFIDIGGDAVGRIKMHKGDTLYGYFTFPPAQPGATSFTFHDNDQMRVISGIVLSSNNP